MKVLHFLHYPKNGIVTVVFELIRHSLSEDIEHEVVLLQRSPKLDKLVAHYGHKVHYLSRPPLQSMRDLRRLLAEVEPDLIHVHSYRPRLLTALASWLGWWQGSVVASVHSEYTYLTGRDPRSRFKRFSERTALHALAAPVIVNNDRVRELAAAAYALPLEAIHKIYPGVSFPEPAEPAAETRPVAVNVARFTIEKNLDLLLDAWADVHTRLPEAKLWLVGDGELKPHLQAKATALGIADSVEFHGWVERNELPRHLAPARVFVLSSDREALPTAAIEASLLGLPVVSTNVAGIDEIVEPDASGLIVAGREGLVQALLRLLSDPATARAMGQCGRERALRRFGVERFVTELETLYREAVAPAAAQQLAES